VNDYYQNNGGNMAVSKKRKNTSNKKKTTTAENKLSEVIMEFVEPLSERINDIVVTKRIIEFGILIWNLSFLPLEEREEQKKSIMKSFSIKEDDQDDDGFNEIYDYLIFRKDALFKNDKRFVVNYKIDDREDNSHLSVGYHLVN